MNILNKLGFYKNADEMLKTDPTKAIPISEQNRLKKAGYDLDLSLKHISEPKRG